MKKTPVLIALFAVVATSPLYAADPTVTTVGSGGNYGGYGPYQTGVGGEFTLYSPDLASYINNYYSGAMDQVSGSTPNFQTFCVEGSEYIYPNTTSYVTLNGVAMYSGNTLSKGAAYLYSQFASGGNFGGNATYNYGAGRTTTAGELQDAIWSFMGGQEGQTMNLSNPFEAAAAIAIGGANNAAGWAAADAAGGADYDGVYILNMWADNGPNEVKSPATAQQDQLIWTGNVPPPGPNNAPDSGATLALLGIGFSSLAFYRHRR